MYGIPIEELGQQQHEAKEPCPRCNGGGVVWGRCCGGLMNQCGCMGMPIDIECHLCEGTGKIDKPLSEEELLGLVDFLNEQKEIDDYMKQFQTDIK